MAGKPIPNIRAPWEQLGPSMSESGIGGRIQQ